MTDFAGLGLSSALVETLTRIKYTTPTPIQEQTIPLVLKGRDILGTAQTGTGKTGAFAIPTIEFLLNSPRGSALIMTPTRELAAQVQVVVKEMLQGQSAVKTALLIGGEPMPKQLSQLRAKPRVIIGTPGRINDHLTRGSLMLHDAGMLILDETDRMLDMGFGIQIDQILKFMPKKRQTLLFSATLPKEILRISKQYLTDPERIEIGQASRPALNIDHKMEKVSDAEKYPSLLETLEEREGSVIIFVKTKRGADKLAMKLRKAEHRSEAIHGDLRQSQRDRVIKGFREKRYRVLVATDVAARGLDIPHIEHVINYDLPQCPEDYIHRIGRTARAGAKGAALCYVTPADRGMWRAISRLLDPTAKGDDADDYEDRRGNQNRRGGSRGRPQSNGYRGKRQDSRPAFGSRDERRQSRGQSSDGDAPRSHSGKPFKAKPARPYNNESGEKRFSRDGNGNSDGNTSRGFKSSRHESKGSRNGDYRPARGNDTDYKPRSENRRSDKPAHFERNEQSKPSFKERPFRADGDGMFKKKSGEKRHGNSEGNKRSFDKPSKHGKNVMRHDGPGSNYFRPSEEEASDKRKEKRTGSSSEKRHASKPSKPSGGNFKRDKPKGDKRSAGSRNGNDDKFAA